ncbi:unnamed protein product [Chrysoparadoxa australica]
MATLCARRARMHGLVGCFPNSGGVRWGSGKSRRRPRSQPPSSNSWQFDATQPSFTVSIVGKPNVGKSTLFNRFAKGYKAIVTPIAGTTRDRKESRVHFGGMDMMLVDTGGLEDDADSNKLYGELSGYVLRKTEQAVRQSDVVFFVIDAKAGVTESDRHFSRWVRERGVENVYLVANKTEGRVCAKVNDSLLDALGLGLGEPLCVSAEHGEGMGELASVLVPHYEDYEKGQMETGLVDGEEAEGAEAQRKVHLAIIGVPNVGKSSILNAILKEDRAMTGPTPGLTRDAVSVEWSWMGRPIKLVDTAGIRKKTRRDGSTPLEELAVRQALSAIGLAQVVVLVVDGTAGEFRRQELSIAQEAINEGRALVVAANKADLVDVSPDQYERGVASQSDAKLTDLGKPPVVAVCALDGYGIEKLLDTVVDAHDRWRRRVPTALLNQWLRKIEAIHAPPRANRREVKFKFMTQVKSGPPTFALFTNSNELADSYQRFLTNKLKEEFGFHGMPLRLLLRRAPNVYLSRGKKPGRGANAAKARNPKARKRTFRNEATEDFHRGKAGRA